MTDEPEKSTNSAEEKEVTYQFEGITINIGGIKGFQACMVIDMEGDIVAVNNKDNIDLDALTDSILGVAAKVNSRTKDLGIGRFYTGEFSGPWGHVLVNIIAGNVLIAQFNNTAPSEDLQARIERIIESCSSTPKNNDNENNEESIDG